VTRIVWAPQAVEDVEAIRTYVARDSPHYADLVVDRIVYRLRHGIIEIATVFHGARLFRLD
jgi:plasmid stabilization system protein ParE